MKKLYFPFIFGILLLTGCRSEENIVGKNPSEGYNYRLEVSLDPSNKTYLAGAETSGARTKVAFGSGEKIMLLDGSGSRLQSKDLTPTDISEDKAIFYFNEKPSDYTFAIYPADNVSSASGNTISTSVLSNQQWVLDNSFGTTANLMVGKITPSGVALKNVCGLVKVTLDASAETNLNSIKMNASSPLAGGITIDFSGSDPLITAVSNPSYSITLTHSTDGVRFKSGYGYYVAVIPGSVIKTNFELGYSDGSSFTATYSGETASTSSFSLQRNHIHKMPAALTTAGRNFTITSQADIDAISGSGITAGNLTVRGSGVNNDVWASIKTKISKINGTLTVDGAAISTTENLIGTSAARPDYGYIDCKDAGFVFKNMSQEINFNSFMNFTAIDGDLVFENVTYPSDCWGWAGATLNNVKTIGGNLIFRNSVTPNTIFGALQTIGGSWIVENAVTGDNITHKFWNFHNTNNTLTSIGGDIRLVGNPDLNSLNGLNALQAANAVKGNVYISRNAIFNSQLGTIKTWKTSGYISGKCELYQADGTLYWKSN